MKPEPTPAQRTHEEISRDVYGTGYVGPSPWGQVARGVGIFLLVIAGACALAAVSNWLRR